MKKINHFMIAGAALLMLAGCSTDELSGNKEGQIPVRLSVSQQTATMRAADGLYTNTTGFDGAEQVEVYVNSNDKHATFMVGSPVGEHKSELTGTLYYPTSGDADLYAVYPATSTASHTVKYNQTTADNYKASDLMYAKKTVTQANKTSTQDLQFSHQLVKLKVVIIKAADVSQVTKVEMKNVKRKATVSLTSSALTLSELTSATDEEGIGANEDKILVFSGTNTETTAQTYAVVFPQQDWSDADFITITADSKEATYKLTKNDFAAGSEYTLTLNINAAALDNTVSITNWTGNDGTCTVNPTTVIETKLAAVNIGMHVGGNPSGVVLKWANMNVGASSETDYGSYFFWAGVAGYGGANASGTATDGFRFIWANTPYNGGNSSFAGTKYTSSDNMTTLESMDDAATVHFGSPWRMPTQAEMQELANTYNTDANAAGKTHLWEWIIDYKGSGHAGYLITCKSNGNSIFLPAAGTRYNTGVYLGEYGNYWSSSLYSDDPSNAWYLNFNSDVANLYNFRRSYGYTVRAVCVE